MAGHRYRVRTPSDDRTTQDRIRWQNPPVQRISSKRVKMIRSAAITAAVALTGYDAYVSYQGFTKLQLPNLLDDNDIGG